MTCQASLRVRADILDAVFARIPWMVSDARQCRHTNRHILTVERDAESVKDWLRTQNVPFLSVQEVAT